MPLPSPPIGQQVGGVFAQDGVAALGFAVLDVLGAQVAGQVAGADDFNAVTKHQDANGGAVKVIAVHQGVDQQLFQRDGRHFQLAQGVEALPFCTWRRLRSDKGKTALKLRSSGRCLCSLSRYWGIAESSCRVERHGFDHAHRQPALGLQA